MENVLLINCTPQEVRVALVENGNLAEFYVERPTDLSIVGNVYKGKVMRVLPGMQAAFIDVGLERAAFLFVSDFLENMQNVYLGEELDEESFKPSRRDLNEDEEAKPTKGKSAHPSQKIQDLLHEGDEIIVQIAKAPIGTKGARVTSHLSLPGRNLVLVPTLHHIGVSRRIAKDEERERLRQIVAHIKPPDVGFIVRTACEGKSEQSIRDDINYLLRLWTEIRQKYDQGKAPCLLHKDLSLSLRAARDLFTPEIDRVVVDDPEEYSVVKAFVHTYLPKLKGALELYRGHEPLFDAFNLESDVSRALDRKVWLKSGGYIIIDQMEALTAVDINTGRFVGKRNLEDTILKTNLEAVREIATQLRLRNIGGIIIIDFIDMQKRTNRDRVYNALQEALKKDKARTNILQISELGLVEMTRKRTQESLGRYLCMACPYCEGRAYVKSPRTICYEILRALRRDFGQQKKPKDLLVGVHPEVANLLAEEERRGWGQMEKSFRCKIAIKPKRDFHLEQYEIIEKSR